MKGKIKKYVALVLSVQQLLCGCSATELEDRCFPMMAVVDEKDGQISFGYGFPKLSQKDNTDLEEAREYRACHGKDDGKLCADL